MEFISYAQNCEDVMLFRAFRNVNAGFYIDVGAGDPDRDSVTRSFYERGWHGINIEPSPELHAQLAAARTRDLNMNVAAGAEPGCVALHDLGCTNRSEQGFPRAAESRRAKSTSGDRSVPRMTLSEICQQHAPGDIHFLKIDVGGDEGSVLAGADFRSFRPHVVLVDATGGSPEAGHGEWEPILTSAGYCFVWFDGLNRYYLANEKREALARHFLAPPNVHDVFLRARNIAAITARNGGVGDATARVAQADARSNRAERRVAAEAAFRSVAETRASRAEVAQLAAQREVAALRASLSWRMTAPLRALMKAWQRPPPPTAGPDGAGPALPEASRLRRTLFVECTHTYFSDVNTGIQRVVRNVLRHAPDVAARYGFDVVPVILENGRFIAADAAVVLSDKQTQQTERAPDAAEVIASAPPGAIALTIRQRILWLGRPIWRGFIWTMSKLLPFEAVYRFLYAPPDRFGLAACVLFPCRPKRTYLLLRGRKPESPGPDLDLRPVSPADVLLLLDSSWHLPIWPAVQHFKVRGGMVVGVAYDLIPISHPDACVPGLAPCFEQWFRNVVDEADAFIAISQATAMALEDYLRRQDNRTGRLPPIAHFHLGSELDFLQGTDEVRPSIKEMFDAEEHVFLMVGSIEPRKNHAFVLEAFERLWTAGGNGCLVIIGRQGWRTDDLVERIRNHPEHGKRLHLLRDANDSELDHAYRNASALIIASEVEGFGLPVVEAFQRGLPVLCSDIAVFREIADGRATFFSLGNPSRLTETLLGFVRQHDPARRHERSPSPWLTWRESTEQLFAAMAPCFGGVQETPERNQIAAEQYAAEQYDVPHGVPRGQATRRLTERGLPA